jgi:hypothetical protein
MTIVATRPGLTGYPRTAQTVASDGDALSEVIAAAGQYTYTSEKAERLTRAGEVWAPPQDSLEYAILQHAPLAYFPLHGPYGLSDWSGLAATVTATGGMTAATHTLNGHNAGAHPGAVSFDGTDDRLATNITTAFTNGVGRTYLALVYVDATAAGSDTILGGDLDNTTVPIFYIDVATQQLVWRQIVGSSGGTSQILGGASSVPLGTWKFVAATVNDTTNTGALYVNGAPVASNTGLGPFNASVGNMKIGAIGTGGSNILKGRLQNVAVLPTALSSTEVYALWQKCRYRIW